MTITDKCIGCGMCGSYSIGEYPVTITYVVTVAVGGMSHSIGEYPVTIT